MNSYLDIAERVLKVARRPMTARAIIKSALQSGIVPSHLYGKTQAKTLQARLSVDILDRKLEGRFFRTDPGHFFLCEFRSDPNIPDKYKDPFFARRRTRELVKSPTLTVNKSYFESCSDAYITDWRGLLNDASQKGALKYVEASELSEEQLPVWTFSIVRRDDEILTYRIGRYRNDHDAFTQKKSIGFPEMLSSQDRTLFSADDYGAAECSLNSVLVDLELSRSVFGKESEPPLPKIAFALCVNQGYEKPALLFVMEWNCPKWYEPTKRRLSLNNVGWCKPTIVNDVDDFEPWSVATLCALNKIRSGRRGNTENEAYFI